MIFANPGYLWLFLLFIPLIAWYVWKQRKFQASLTVSSASPFAKLPTSWKVYLRHFLFVMKLAMIGCIIVILSRPQSTDSWSKSETEGTDIVMALDISTSMLAKDFKPNRLEAAKDVACQFVNGRTSDNIGMVIFAGEALTLVPLTTDKPTIINYIQNLNMGLLEDGTAIGDGLATAINRIKDGKAKSKSIILLTDGSNNTGTVYPQSAAEIAKSLGIKIYTIGVGTNGNAPYPVAEIGGVIQYQSLPVVIDEGILKNIASQTGGKYFRATDKKVLKSIFDEIDKLEKTKLDVQNFSNTEDDYMPWAIVLLVLFLSAFLLRHVVLRDIP